MKIKHLLIAVLTGAALVGCNKEGADQLDKTQRSYMAFNVVAPNSMTKGSVGSPEFDGIEEESKLDNIYFFFYVNNAFLCEGKVISDLSGFGFGSAASGNTVEKGSSNAVVVLETNGTKPNGVLCFINLSASDRSALRGKTLPDAIAYTNKDRTGIKHIQFGYENAGTYYFTMSNSVYCSSSKYIQAYTVTGANCASSEALAVADPVTIYVDRIAAKVSAVTYNDAVDAYNFNDGAHAYNITLQNWGLNATNRFAFFTKNVDAAWATAGSAWMGNTSGEHRMFWEQDPNYRTADAALVDFPNIANEFVGDEDNSPLWYFSYNQITNSAAEAAVPATKFHHNDTGANQYSGGLVRNYCFPNTFGDAFKANFRRVGTHVLVVAQAKMDGAVKTFYEYNGVHYVEADYITVALANINATNQLYYYDAGTMSYKPLDAAHVKIAKAIVNASDEIEETTGASDGYVSVFSTLPKTGLFFYNTATTAYELISDAQYKQAFTTDIVERANCYTDGLMYYCVPIEHLAASSEAYGVHGMVRNHDYRVTVTGVSTLGKGIYDPAEPIVPGDKSQKWFLAAKININAWHVVSQNAVLSE
ncbi:MAG: Mfa1 fimbrilin C-terminal domain-containing protein [Bacteroidales bacterium]|nr:Mfa1 fimbrilin C-terminal domain-containing protein [Bacteroidales bacterium]